MEFENPTFDPNGADDDNFENHDTDGLDDDYTSNPPDTPMEPPEVIQREPEPRIQELWEELKQTALEYQKKHLVDAFYNEVSRAYRLHPKDSIDYDQFGIDPDGKMFFWTPGNKKIPITATRGRF